MIPNRTVMYERHLEQISNLRKQCIEANTAARAFSDYATILTNVPTMGAIADRSRDMLVEYARKCAGDCRKLIDSNTVLADKMEREGMPD